MKSYISLLLLCTLQFCVQSCAGQAVLLEDEKETVTREALRYYLYLPPGYEAASAEAFPLLLFLHGGGESGRKLEKIKQNGPPKMLAEGHEFPFLVLAPQNPNARQWWNTRAVMQLLDQVIEEHNVDRQRIYLTGLSRGGGAAWEMAVQFPDRFAALAVVCGMSPLPYASWLNKAMPIWVFHGTEDKSIPFSESEEMVKRLEELGYNVRFTIYEGLGHEAWVPAYRTEELYDWMVEQRLP